MVLKDTSMSRVFITGSTDGLGLMAARLLVGDDHRVMAEAFRRAGLTGKTPGRQ
jgi:NAD(P)-dependent dehydrogenase (short-subunit alcohol dehydrogenase family)